MNPHDPAGHQQPPSNSKHDSRYICNVQVLDVHTTGHEADGTLTVHVDVVGGEGENVAYAGDGVHAVSGFRSSMMTLSLQPDDTVHADTIFTLAELAVEHDWLAEVEVDLGRAVLRFDEADAIEHGLINEVDGPGKLAGISVPDGTTMLI